MGGAGKEKGRRKRRKRGRMWGVEKEIEEDDKYAIDYDEGESE